MEQNGATENNISVEDIIYKISIMGSYIWADSIKLFYDIEEEGGNIAKNEINAKQKKVINLSINTDHVILLNNKGYKISCTSGNKSSNIKQSISNK